MSERDRVFRKQLRRHLDQGLAELDGDTINRLRQARLKAAQGKPASRRRRDWLVLGGTVAAITLALVVSLRMETASPPQSMLEDLALLSAQEELVFYSELDFYAWLQQRERGGEV